jgi:TonB family protein
VDWAPGSPAVTDSTLFDLASMTKVVATTTAAAMLEEQGRLDVDQRVAWYLPEITDTAKQRITVRQILTHRGGFEAFADLYRRFRGREQYLHQIDARPLRYAPGTRTVYSDWDLVLGGLIVERIAGDSLDRWTAAHVFAPLGMRDTRFRPDPSLRPRIAATELDSARGHIWGEVHDPNAWAIGGVAGHAGLFGSARDLAIFAQSGGARGIVRQRARPGDLRADAAERRVVRRRAHSQARDGGALDGARVPRQQPRAGVGHAVAQLQRGALLRAALVRAHGLHGHVHLDRPGARRVRDPADESRRSDQREPEARPPPSRRRRRRAARHPRRPARRLGGGAGGALTRVEAVCSRAWHPLAANRLSRDEERDLCAERRGRAFLRSRDREPENPNRGGAMRSFLRLSLLVTVLCGVQAGAADGQRSERDLARAWRTTRDSAAAEALYRETVARGGARLLRAVEQAAADRSRPELTRVHAIAALYAWLRPFDADRVHAFVWAARDATGRCRSSTAWTEGDTLQACAFAHTIWEYPVGASRFPSAPAPRPRPGDSAAVVEVARRIAATEPSTGPAGAADLLLSTLHAAPAASRAIACTQAAARTPRGRALRSACEVTRVLSRNYPPLLRDADVGGRVVLAVTVGADGVVRSSRIATPDPHDEFNVVAMRVAERMRFNPVTGAGEQELTVPIRWDRAPEYPRVAAAAR